MYIEWVNRLNQVMFLYGVEAYATYKREWGEKTEEIDNCQAVALLFSLKHIPGKD
jgi:hypothetical protein